MPNRYAYPDRPQLQLRIIARVAAGETVRAICAEDGMPCEGSLQVWRRADAGFAAALAAARRRGDWGRRLAFDEAKAQAFLARLAEGARLAEVLDKPGMPSQRAYRYWRRTNGAFQEALWRLKGAREARRTAALRARHRGFDQGVADKILVRVSRGEPMRRMLETDPALPCRVVVYRWRREQPEWDAAIRIAIRVGRLARERARSRCTPELVEQITGRLVTGASLRSLARAPDMPCARTLYAWAARREDFAAEVERACDVREWWYLDQMADMAQRNGPFGLAATKREAAPLQRQLNRLAKRPGWKRSPPSRG